MMETVVCEPDSFDLLISELESNEDSLCELNEARQWVLENFNTESE